MSKALTSALDLAKYLKATLSAFAVMEGSSEACVHGVKRDVENTGKNPKTKQTNQKTQLAMISGTKREDSNSTERKARWSAGGCGGRGMQKPRQTHTSGLAHTLWLMNN